MQKYFINEINFNNKEITGDDAFHIAKVMRARVNDRVLVGFDSKSYLVELKKISTDFCQFEIIEELEDNKELPCYITIIQGYPKGDKFEDIIKHGTELGAYNFIPCLMERSQFKVDEKRKENKIIRFNKITKEAAEQSFRNIIPEVLDFVKLKDIDFSKFNKVFVCFEEDAKNGELRNFKNFVKNIKVNDKIAVIIGPEGGISEIEIIYLKSKGAIIGSLGKRILRTETAVFYVLSSLSYELELKD